MHVWANNETECANGCVKWKPSGQFLLSTCYMFIQKERITMKLVDVWLWKQFTLNNLSVCNKKVVILKLEIFVESLHFIKEVILYFYCKNKKQSF